MTILIISVFFGTLVGLVCREGLTRATIPTPRVTNADYLTFDEVSQISREARAARMERRLANTASATACSHPALDEFLDTAVDDLETATTGTTQTEPVEPS